MTTSYGMVPDGRIHEEITSGFLVSSMTLLPDRTEEPARIAPLTLWVRATGKGHSLKIFASCAEGAAGVDASPNNEELVAEFFGPMSDRVLEVPLLMGLCDAVTFRLEMMGEWVIHDVVRRYEVVPV